MTQGTKPALKSGSILANLFLFLPALDLMRQEVEQLPAGLLPPAVQGAMVGVGTLVAIYKRITAKKTIKGILK